MIQLRELAIGYKGQKTIHTIAQHLNSTLHSGELTCLIGANGVGKSTLLRTLSAFQPAISGEIIIADKNILSYSGHELSKIISVVLTERIEVNHLSVNELISFGRSPYTGFWGKLKANDKKTIQEALKSVHILHLANRPVQTLSDGERQKVLIAKAIAQQTPIVFLDEPTIFLDFPSKVEMLQMLHHLSRERNKTILLSTHDLDLAFQIADNIWLLDNTNGLIASTTKKMLQSKELKKFLLKAQNIMLNNKTFFQN